jgi:hypothetical protein
MSPLASLRICGFRGDGRLLYHRRDGAMPMGAQSSAAHQVKLGEGKPQTDGGRCAMHEGRTQRSRCVSLPTLEPYWENPAYGIIEGSRKVGIIRARSAP